MTSLQAVQKLNSTIYNFLSTDEQYFETSIGNWAAVGASIQKNIAFRLKDTYHTLEVLPDSSSDVTLFLGSTSGGSVSVDRRPVPTNLSTDSLTFYMFARCDKRTQFDITLTNSRIQLPIIITGTLQSVDDLPLSGESGDTYLIETEIYQWVRNDAILGRAVWDIIGTQKTESVVVNALTWTVVRGPELQVPQTATSTTIQVEITAKSHQGDKFYIGHPSLVNTLHLVDNLFVRLCMSYMPEVLLETDRNQTLPDYPMLRIMDLGTLYANRGVNQLYSFRYNDIESGFKESDPSTRSKLVDPDVADLDYLNWLAQIVGVRLTQVGAGSTPWGNLPDTWQTFYDQVDRPAETEDEGEPDDEDAEWFEIESFNTADANFSDNRRTQIKNAQTGYRSGISDSLEIALLEVLRGDKQYKMYRDPIGSPWTIIIRTLDSETPGGVVGSSSETLLLTLNKSRPMGFVIDHECVAIESW